MSSHTASGRMWTIISHVPSHGELSPLTLLLVLSYLNACRQMLLSLTKSRMRKVLGGRPLRRSGELGLSSSALPDSGPERTRCDCRGGGGEEGEEIKRGITSAPCAAAGEGRRGQRAEGGSFVLANLAPTQRGGNRHGDGGQGWP